MDKFQKRERKNSRNRPGAKRIFAKLKAEFPKLEVIIKGDKEGEVCDLGRTAMKTGMPMEEICNNLRFGAGKWETSRFVIQVKED